MIVSNSMRSAARSNIRKKSVDLPAPLAQSWTLNEAHTCQLCSSTFQRTKSSFALATHPAPKVHIQLETKDEISAPSNREVILDCMKAIKALSKKSPEKLSHFLRGSLTKIFFSQFGSSETKKDWLRRCIDFSLLFNAISMCSILIFQKLTEIEMEQEHEDQPTQADASACDLPDQLAESFTQAKDFLNFLEPDWLDDEPSDEDQEAFKALSSFEKLLSLQKDVLIGIGFCQSAAQIFLKK